MDPHFQQRQPAPPPRSLFKKAAPTVPASSEQQQHSLQQTSKQSSSGKRQNAFTGDGGGSGSSNPMLSLANATKSKIKGITGSKDSARQAAATAAAAAGQPPATSSSQRQDVSSGKRGSGAESRRCRFASKETFSSGVTSSSVENHMPEPMELQKPSRHLPLSNVLSSTRQRDVPIFDPELRLPEAPWSEAQNRSGSGSNPKVSSSMTLGDGQNYPISSQGAAGMPASSREDSRILQSLNASASHEKSLSLDQAEYLLTLAVQGKSLSSNFKIDSNVPAHPKGGCIFLVPTSKPHQDEYQWKEILRQPNIPTNSHHLTMNYVLYHVMMDEFTPSPVFKKEYYEMDGQLLICYTGDDRVITRKQRNALIIAGELANRAASPRRGDNLYHRGSSSHQRYQQRLEEQEDLLESELLAAGASPRIGGHSGSAFNSWPRNPKSATGGSSRNGSLANSGAHIPPLLKSGLHKSSQQGFEQFAASSSQSLFEKELGSSANTLLQGRPTATVSPWNPRPLSATGAPGGRSPSLPRVALESYTELLQVAEELACGKVVKNMTVFPSLQVTLLHPDMTKEFERCCKYTCTDTAGSHINGSAAAASSSHAAMDLNSVTGGSTGSEERGVNGIKLFYDTTFSIGSMYVTLLTFVNCCYEGNPVMPLAINLHEAKFKSSHQLFWARIVGDLPILQKYRFPLLIDDAEPAVHLAVRTQAPNLVQLEAWTHRFRDIDEYLRQRGYGDEAIHYYKTCVNYLLRSRSKQAMHDRFRKEFEGVWPKDFVFYYRQRLLPRSGRLGQWAMAKMKITDEDFLSPYSNPQETFHSLCRYFSEWADLSTDQIVRAFYFLFLYFVTETGNGARASSNPSLASAKAGPAFTLKTMYKTLDQATNSAAGGRRGEASKNNCLVPHPSRIAEFILRNYPAARGARASSSWLASFGATEVYATTRLRDTLGRDNQPKMEDSCDMQYRVLSDLVQKESLEEAVARAANVSTGQGRRSRENSGGQHPAASAAASLLKANELDSLLRPPSLLDFDPAGAGSSSRSPHKTIAQHLREVPSPAPNGSVPSPAPPEDSAGGSYNHLSTIPEAPSEQSLWRSSTEIVEHPSGHSEIYHDVVYTTCPSPAPPPTQQQLQQHKQQQEVVMMTSGAGSSDDHGQHSLDDPVSTGSKSSTTTYRHSAAAALAAGQLSLSVPVTSSSATSAVVHSSHGGVAIPSANGRKNPTSLPLSATAGGDASHPARNNLTLPTSASMRHANPALKDAGGVPSSMMLWKKVQHCVVFGGSFVTAAKEGGMRKAQQHHLGDHFAPK